MLQIISYLKSLFQAQGAPVSGSPSPSKQLSHNLLENLIYFRQQYDGSSDLTIRECKVAGVDAAVITIEGMINKQVFATSVLNPILQGAYPDNEPENIFCFLRDELLSTSEQVQVTSFDEAFSLAMSGFALVAIDGYPAMLAIGVQGFSFRGLSEPSNEVMQRGAKEGFTEPLRINMTLIRRRMKNPQLKFEMLTVGSVSKTAVCLCYLRNMVSPNVLQQIRTRLNRVDLENVLAAGYLVPYLEQEGDLSLFSSVGISERPDTVCGKLAEGRVAILVDGTPFVLLVPFLFVENFQTMDDYTSRPFYATFIRWLKYFAFFGAMLLPGLYVAIGTYNPELFPGELLNKIASNIASTPFSLMTETLLIHFIYEIMREAGLRLPKPLGHAVSIVGGLVVGDAAISAGLIGATTLMVVALTAISSYVVPSLYEPLAVLRLAFILIGGLMGIWGVMLLFCVVLINLCSKSNCGIPYTAPVSPFSLFGMRDVGVRAGWKTLSKRNNPVQQMPGAHVEEK